MLEYVIWIVPAVTEHILAQLMWLDYDNPHKPLYLYINSSGTHNEKNETVGSETDAYSVADMFRGFDHFKKVKYYDGITYGELFLENEYLIIPTTSESDTDKLLLAAVPDWPKTLDQSESNQIRPNNTGLTTPGQSSWTKSIRGEGTVLPHQSNLIYTVR